MKDYDYRCLGDLDDDVLLIEWDLAIEREALDRFIEQIEAEPDRVHTAPYRIYSPTERAVTLPKPFWVGRVYEAGEQTMRQVDEDDPVCHTFGLGLTYMPCKIIREFLDHWPGHFSDLSFSGWHYRRYGPVPIAWDVRPIHLHYLIEEYA